MTPEASRLAVVVPVFKGRYLTTSLESLSRQTSQDFTVYVGDDASPEDLAKVVDRYRDLLRIRYVRFPGNLGGTSLAKQWERCIRLSREPWVWLFSDDDVASPDCVETFYRTLGYTSASYDVYRFDVQFIDGEGQWLRSPAGMPSVMSSVEMLYQRVVNSVFSAAPEHVFSRAAYEREGGFVEFPLAWCSDHASWLGLARRTGIHVVPGPRVMIRCSGINISSRRDLGALKAEATLAFVKWLMEKTEDKAFFGLQDQQNTQLMEAVWRQLPKWFYNRLLNDGFPLTDRVAVLGLQERIVGVMGARANDFLAPLANHACDLPPAEVSGGLCRRLWRTARNRIRC